MPEVFTRLSRAIVTVILFAVGQTAISSEGPGPSADIDRDAPRRVYWGDTHLHSDYSTDALGFGVRLGPDAAYRFSAGELLTSSNGLPVKLARPLDFVVLADHAESLGLMSLVRAGDPRVLNETTRDWHRSLNGGQEQVAKLLARFYVTKERKHIVRTLGMLADDALQLEIWREYLAIAERHYRPGVFTTLLGYEWTSAPSGNNLHRVVVHRDGSDRVGKHRPFSALDSDDPMDLWKYLSDYERSTGGKVLAIPHNGNLSNGLMFPAKKRMREQPVGLEYARMRARWEPIYEVTQIKGDGETHPLLSPDDGFADYETWDFGNFRGVPKQANMLSAEYARSALGTGLQVAAQYGVNPYRFGLIGSTDAHTALPAVAENNFLGKHSAVEPSPDRWNAVVGRGGDKEIRGWQQAASGYAAVWATDNTREALFDAMGRREVYATTGSRITVRVFGGWQFQSDDAKVSDIAARGYSAGVPMGGLLSNGGGKAPGFIVSASKDSQGANLDQVQIVKVWIDSNGETHEKIFPIAWSGDRELTENGHLPPVGSTVDPRAATWINDIGEPQLSAFWEDPEFQPEDSALYYVRVLEIPTPRWTAYDRSRFGLAMPRELPMTTRERAYTSPIWYRPTAQSVLDQTGGQGSF